MTVYMIGYQKWEGEDNNGRDYYGDAVDFERGYFLTREDCQAEVDRLKDAQLANHHKALANDIAEHARRVADRDKAQKTVQILQEQGLDTSLVKVPWVGEYRERSFYDEDQYAVVEIEQAS